MTSVARKTVKEILKAAHDGHVEELVHAVADAAANGDQDRCHLLAKAAAQIANNSLVANHVDDPINAPSPDGATPLFLAAKGGHLECARILLDARANVAAATSAGFTPLFIAALRGKSQVVRLLLEQYGVAVDQPAEDGRTPLYAACESGSVECVRALIGAGASLESRRSDDTTPLIVASYFGHAGVVELLLLNGAKLSPRDEDGHALDNARAQGKAQCVELLTQALADRSMSEADLREAGDLVAAA